MGKKGSRNWLNEKNEFIFGKHEGESLAEVAVSNPDYLEWILENVDNIADDDYLKISQELGI